MRTAQQFALRLDSIHTNLPLWSLANVSLARSALVVCGHTVVHCFLLVFLPSLHWSIKILMVSSGWYHGQTCQGSFAKTTILMQSKVGLGMVDPEMQSRTLLGKLSGSWPLSCSSLTRISCIVFFEFYAYTGESPMMDEATQNAQS